MSAPRPETSPSTTPSSGTARRSLLAVGLLTLSVLPVRAAFLAPAKRSAAKPAATRPTPAPKPEPAVAADLAKSVQPFVKEHCLRCHGPEKQLGKLRLDTLGVNLEDPLVAAKWAEVMSVVNNRQMPPANEKQPSADASGEFVERIRAELARAEIAKRPARVVLRRMNRAEYNNTIRDLVGVDFQPADAFPEDPPAGGFDNIGQALTLSPLQIELYYAAARQILDRALVEGPQPPVLKWHFEPEENTMGADRYRVRRDGNNILLNDGNNPTENGMTVVHHDNWDKGIGFRDFRLPVEGQYTVRFRAAGRVPARAAVVSTARTILERRRDQQNTQNPRGKVYHDRQFEADLQHFATHRMYDYGAPRVKVTQHLGSAPGVIGELDIDASETAPKVYEIRAHFTKQSAGLDFSYAYEIPRVLENFWMQTGDAFARPVLLVDWIELEGPVHPSWPPPSHRQVLGDAAGQSRDETAAARQILTRFMTRAYRRPVQPQEVEAKVSLFGRVRTEKPSFVEAMKVPLAAVLASPHFLFLVEPETLPAQPRKLNGYELAARLSYFLWSSMPDDALSQLAAKGELAKPAVLAAQVDRMLADPKSDAFVKNFTGQWLGLRKVGANPPAKNLYPEYDRHLEISIVKETEGFFAEILRQNLDARSLIKSDFVTINERLARFYGIPGVKGDAIRRVPAPPAAHRGGLITQASIQTITSNGTRTSPVARGVWILKTLLGTDPGLPVANVGEIASKVPGIDKATVRQRLQIHRENPACARCHDRIDPLGFALENFNAAGEWRDREGHGYQGRIEANDPLIDASAKMPDGTEIRGVEGLQAALLKQEDLFLNALATQLTTYALGRELGFSDQPAVRSHVAMMKRDRYSLRSLLVAIVTSEQFNTK